MKSKKVIRIPKGEMNCYGDSVADIVERLMSKGFKIADLDEATVELDESGCYYESDRPSINVEWPNIYESV